MLDGVSLGSPFSGQFRKDPSLHLLELSGPGLRSLKQLISFERDLSLEIALEALPERAPQQASRRSSKNDKPVAQAPSAPPPRAEEPTPAATPAPAAAGYGDDMKGTRPRVSRGHIDSTDPYAK